MVTDWLSGKTKRDLEMHLHVCMNINKEKEAYFEAFPDLRYHLNPEYLETHQSPP